MYKFKREKQMAIHRLVFVLAMTLVTGGASVNVEVFLTESTEIVASAAELTPESITWDENSAITDNVTINAAGHTLIVAGEGTLYVEGQAGAAATSENKDGSAGKSGVIGISGTLTVKGGNVFAVGLWQDEVPGTYPSLTHPVFLICP